MVKSGVGRADGAQIAFRQAVEFSKICRVNGEVTPLGVCRKSISASSKKCGVVEARSSTGELLGFERLAQLTLKSAREIADTAKAFGQQDDITVLTLARTA